MKKNPLSRYPLVTTQARRRGDFSVASAKIPNQHFEARRIGLMGPDLEPCSLPFLTSLSPLYLIWQQRPAPSPPGIYTVNALGGRGLEFQLQWGFLSA